MTTVAHFFFWPELSGAGAGAGDLLSSDLGVPEEKLNPPEAGVGTLPNAAVEDEKLGAPPGVAPDPNVLADDFAPDPNVLAEEKLNAPAAGAGAGEDDFFALVASKVEPEPSEPKEAVPVDDFFFESNDRPPNDKPSAPSVSVTGDTTANPEVGSALLFVGEGEVGGSHMEELLCDEDEVLRCRWEDACSSLATSSSTYSPESSSSTKLPTEVVVLNGELAKGEADASGLPPFKLPRSGELGADFLPRRPFEDFLLPKEEDEEEDPPPKVEFPPAPKVAPLAPNAGAPDPKLKLPPFLSLVPPVF